MHDLVGLGGCGCSGAGTVTKSEAEFLPHL